MYEFQEDTHVQLTAEQEGRPIPGSLLSPFQIEFYSLVTSLYLTGIFTPF